MVSSRIDSNINSICGYYSGLTSRRLDFGSFVSAFDALPSSYGGDVTVVTPYASAN